MYVITLEMLEDLQVGDVIIVPLRGGKQLELIHEDYVGRDTEVTSAA